MAYIARRKNNIGEITSWQVTEDGDGGGGEEREFLRPDEVEGIASCMPKEQSGGLVRGKYATGLRGGCVGVEQRVTVALPGCPPCPGQETS